ncbi:methyltransferase domain-containing protein [Pseudoalteromonas sp. J010]|uniref:class I SAM-dependent methyltransferase n=1 Tax=Pseudoalteromonas sp. J010 TaxID=998465 RepID=UPI000F648B88|nr:class I SAM-dependent methyltransferase [Pseudoalteromonas sp. J010]RRS09036.1 methyltransferase domain-containing protein [Pseudoalteromonas sp. J010]
MNCRHCGNELALEMVNLGCSPASNAYLRDKDAFKNEITYSLRVLVCEQCWLVQTDDQVEAEALFTDEYAYFSSVSASWLKHAKSYTEVVTQKLGLNKNSLVVEVASNDGYLLQNFVKNGIPNLGVEPTAAVARAAKARGINVIEEFFDTRLANVIAMDYGKADLIIANNVLAHVPDINSFVQGFKELLSEAGTVTLEFPSLLNIITQNQFDTIYHEHYSYLNLCVVEEILSKAGLKVYDVEELSTHGGSLRVWASHQESSHHVAPSVNEVKQKEIDAKLFEPSTYLAFSEKVTQICEEFKAFLVDAKLAGKTVVGYGAAAKGNTLLNTAGVKNNLISAVFDSAPSKQNQYLPGSHIPILPPDAIESYKPDYVVIFPWNIKDEICQYLATNSRVNWKYCIAIPNLEIFDG